MKPAVVILFICAACVAGDRCPSAAQPGDLETIVSRFPAPDGCRRIVSAPGSFPEWVRNLPLLPDTCDALDWRGQVALRADEIGGVLAWHLLGSMEQCADVAVRLIAEYNRSLGNATSLTFRTLSGHPVGWTGWCAGRYRTDPGGTTIIYQPGSSRRATAVEFDAYLRFVMTYTNSAALMRDWPPVVHEPPAIGDVLIQPCCPSTGMGHLSIIVDACEKADGVVRYIFVDGYTPARMPVVRQQLPGQPETVWMTPEEYLQLQSPFGPGRFHRYPGSGGTAVSHE